ncbi:MAG: DUF302 domain-containing protein [Burkholderiaceae bacterium]
MKNSFVLAVGGLFAVCTAAHAADGLVELESPYSARQTMDRLEQAVTDRGLKVFARIDHAAGAASVGKTLRATELLIFGNPQGGTPFMQCAQTVGIDLPLKALAWEAADGRVLLAYNDPVYLARRHGVSDCAVAPRLREALDGLAGAAVAK